MKNHNPEKISIAKANNLRIGAQKLNLVAGLIRKKHVSEAIKELEFCRKRIARDVLKCLMSAIANADNNHNMDIDLLYVNEAFISKAIVMKRIRARARGRAARILKPFTNLTIKLSEGVF